MILYPGCSREEQGRQLQGGADGRDPSSLPLAGLPLAGLPLSVRTELLAAVASALPYYSDPDQVRGQGGGQREVAGGGEGLCPLCCPIAWMGGFKRPPPIPTRSPNFNTLLFLCIKSDA